MKKLWKDIQVIFRYNLDTVTSVNYDPTGNYLVSSSSDLSVKLWDLNNDNVCIKTFNGHNHSISYAVFLGTDYILSCGRDKTIKMW